MAKFATITVSIVDSLLVRSCQDIDGENNKKNSLCYEEEAG